MKKFILFSILLISCGTDKIIDNQQPNEPPVIIDPNEKPSFSRIQEIHRQYCIQCHANSSFVKSEELLKASTAKQRVINKSMPQRPVVMPEAVRNEYLGFFSS